MTIQNTNLRKAGPYQANGVTIAFSFDFKVFSGSDLAVIRADSLGVETTLTLGSDYTVALNPNQNTVPGGVVNMITAPATGYTITLTSNLTYTQNLALTNAGGFYPEAINDALDRIVIQIQQLAEQLSRTFKVPISSILIAGQSVADYLTAAAASAAAAATSAGFAAGSATSAGVQASNAASNAAIAQTAAGRATAPAVSVIDAFLENFFPHPQLTTFSAIYLAGGWDMGSIVTSTFTNETVLRRASLATGSTTTDLGTVP